MSWDTLHGVHYSSGFSPKRIQQKRISLEFKFVPSLFAFFASQPPFPTIDVQISPLVSITASDIPRGLFRMSFLNQMLHEWFITYRTPLRLCECIQAFKVSCGGERLKFDVPESAPE